MGLGLSLGIPYSNYQDFTLTDVSDLSLWLKNGASVARGKWEDSSGNNNHALQGTENAQAVVSSGGLDFEAGSSNFYGLTSSISIGHRGGFCMAIVVNRESTSTQAIVSDSTNEELSFQNGTTTFRIKTNTGAAGTNVITTDAVFAGGTFDQSQKFLFLINRSIGVSNVFSFFKNGVALTADVDTSTNEATGENPNGFDFDTLGASNSGASNYFDGKILELAFWSKGLSAAEIANVNSYLQSVHGL
tara:strand:+ start:375 stop:1112 length:738 start_codon:yes stop_codon:yes gene_type:complete